MDAYNLRSFRGGIIDMENETPPSSPQSVPVNFIDNPAAPDVFADEAVGFFVHNGVVKITFVSARVNHSASPGPINRVVNWPPHSFSKSRTGFGRWAFRLFEVARARSSIGGS
jgi:hypothetical protein